MTRLSIIIGIVGLFLLPGNLGAQNSTEEGQTEIKIEQEPIEGVKEPFDVKISGETAGKGYIGSDIKEDAEAAEAAKKLLEQK